MARGFMFICLGITAPTLTLVLASEVARSTSSNPIPTETAVLTGALDDGSTIHWADRRRRTPPPPTRREGDERLQQMHQA